MSEINNNIHVNNEIEIEIKNEFINQSTKNY